MKLPWSLVSALLVALLALYLTADRFVGLPIFALLLIVSQTTHGRLSRSRLLAAAIRITVFSVIVAIIGWPDESFRQWYMRPAYTNLAGCLLAAEVAIRSWERPEAARTGDPRGVMLFLSALVMAAVSNTFVRTYIQLLAPAYLLLVLLTLRRFGVSPAKRTGLIALRASAALAAVVIGFLVVGSITKYDRALTSWAVDLLNARKSKMPEIGLSGSPRLGAISNPKPSLSRMLLIDGPPSERHLRALAFDVLQDRQWKPALRERPFFSVDPRDLRTDAPGQRLVFTRVGDSLDLLPLPSNIGSVQSSATVERDEFGSLRHQDEGLSGSLSRYEAVVPGDERFQGPLNTKLDDVQRERALALPETLDPKIVELSRQIAGEGEPMSRVLKLSAHLRSSNSYGMSYDPGGADPISDFILNRRAAHCQYFASALVVMSRAAGVPARLATGFYAHERYGDGQMVVRQRDAHAWAECWIDGVGWITLDATPSGGRPDQLFEQASSLRRAWERFTDLPGLLRDWIARISQRKLLTILIATAMFFFGTWLLGTLLAKRRKNRNTLEYPQPAKEIIAVTRRFQHWLKHRRVPCAPSTTWREHVQSLDPLCIQFVHAYEQARFGGADGPVVRRLHTIMDQLEQSVWTK